MIDLDFRKKDNGVPILSKKQIEEFAEAIIGDYNPQLLNSPASIDIEDFAEFYLGLEMDYAVLSTDRSILGMTVFNECYISVYEIENNCKRLVPVKEGTIMLDTTLFEEDQLRRGRFTVGHESSHWILHRHIYSIPKGQISLDFSDEKSVVKCLNRDVENTVRRNSFSTDSDWIEWQADYMSSALLMPKKTFDMAVQKIFNEAGYKQRYIVKGIDSDLEMFIEGLPVQLAEIYDVSIQAAFIRLEKLGYIRDKSIIQQESLFKFN